MKNIAHIAISVVLRLVLLSFPAYAAEPTVSIKVISESGARRVIEDARQEAKRINAPCAIAVVDSSGILVSFDKMDGVRASSSDLAVGKARTSALLQRSSGEVEDNTNTGRVAFVTSGLLALRGGMPLIVNGEVVGAVGVAGVNKENDVTIAEAAAQSFADSLEGH